MAEVMKRVIAAGCFCFLALGVLCADGGESLRFVAYNVQNYQVASREPGGTGGKPEKARDVVVATLVSLNADVLGLCEVGGEHSLMELRGRLEKAGRSYPHVEWVDGADKDRQLALLSRFPLSKRNSVTRLTYEMGGRVLPVQRGFLDVTVQVGQDWQVRCIGVHFKSRRPVPEGRQELMRRYEAALLRKRIDEILGEAPDQPLLVYGDLNDTRNEATVKVVQGTPGRESFLTALPLEDPYGMRWTHYWNEADVYARIDFILVNAGLRSWFDEEASTVHFREDWEVGSDHRALLAVFRR